MLHDRMHRTIRIALLGAATMLPYAARAADEASSMQAEEHWDVLYIGDQRIGYARSTTEPVAEQGRRIVRTTNETHMTIKRFGQALQFQTLLTADETPEGELLGFTLEMRNPPAAPTTTVGRVEGRVLKVETTVAGRAQTRTVDWQPEIKGPSYEDRVLRELATRPGRSRRFKTFLPELNQITDVRAASEQLRQVELLDGESHQLMKITVTQSALPTMPVRSYVDTNGEPLRTETDFLGMTLITYAVPQEKALEAIAGGELDLAVNTLVRVDPITNAHKTRRAMYRITTPGQNPAKYLVAGGTQRVRAIDDDTAELTVTSAAIPERSLDSRTPVPEEYVSATRFLQTGDPLVQDHATRGAAGEFDPVKVALRMEHYVHEKLSKKNFSTALASAAEVAEKLEGDCTEHAVLLAAMLRAKQIPSRVAVGLVYVQNRQSFGGHMWTEAYLNGRWIPLDATLGQGGIGAAHIKLAESSLADDAPAPISAFLPLFDVLGKMQIDVVETE